MTARTEIHADGTFNDQTGIGGWAAVVARSTSGKQDNTSIYEMELRAMVEAVKMAEGPTTVISDYEWLVRNAQRGTPQATCRPLWDELFAAASGKDIEYAWNIQCVLITGHLSSALLQNTQVGKTRSVRAIRLRRRHPSEFRRCATGFAVSGLPIAK